MDRIRVAKVDNVALSQSERLSESAADDSMSLRQLTGTLHLTPHHLIFSPTSSSTSATEIWVAYPTITLMTRLPQSIRGQYPLQVRTRLFDNYTLSFDSDRDADEVWQSVKDCAVLSSVESLYAFFYTHSGATTGWSAYNPRNEFSRQGLGSRTKAWRFTDINKDYDYCSTYPSKLVVPSRISDSVLSYAGKYRSKSRIPALTYLHWANHASITRSSQPMVGLKNARSSQDERLIECIFSAHLFPDTAYTSTTPEPVVYGSTSTNLIIDARPTTNAMANVAMGAGTENMDNYRSGKKAYLGIDNIHVMRNSLKMVTDATLSNPPDRTLLRKSNWLRHISTLLDGALVIIKNVHYNASHVLIHCSDGWDRTSQLSATAQLCLDPYYRTLDGFKVLIEKDWLSFGHKFLDRSGHLSSEHLFTQADPEDSDDEVGGAQKAAQAFFASVQKQFSSTNHSKEVSPVFHQFLDCIWQIHRQYPNRFEFTEDLLIHLYTQLYTCQYGTFLFNNEQERRRYTDKTISVWDSIDPLKYRNSTFDPGLDDPNSREPSADQGVLTPNARDVRFWYRLFKRGDEEMNGGDRFVPGAPVIGPIGSGQTDPVSIEGLATDLSSTNISRKSSPVPAPVPFTTGPSQSQSPRQSAPQPGPWRWSQISSGAFSAISGAAKEIKSISQEALNQIKAEATDSNELWSRGREIKAEPQGSSQYVSEHRPSATTSLRLPSETNPWSIPIEASQNTDSMLSSPPMTPMPAVTRHPSEERAALGDDRKAWDPLGAL